MNAPSLVSLVLGMAWYAMGQGVASDVHWAFQPIAAPALPASATGPAQNPIDALLNKRLDTAALTAQPPAAPDIRLRRVALDLTGLPPTLDERSAFLNDRSPEPLTRVVDQLLTSPRHAQHWARHWMDVWRYSDWYGLGAQLRYSQKHLWHWREWIVDAILEDKGYDRMVLEMLAGDEFAPDDADIIRATGFLARNYYLFNRTTWLDATIEHTSKAFLGLTMNCAKCHDHKYDPVTHEDYYRMRAIFEPHQVRLDQVPGEINFERDGLPRVFDEHLSALTYLHKQGNEQTPDKSKVIEPGVPGFLGKLTIEPLALPRPAYAPGSRDYVRRDHRESLAHQRQEALRANTNADNDAKRAHAASWLRLIDAKRAALEARIAADDAALKGESVPSDTTMLEWQAELRLAEHVVLEKQQALARAADDQRVEAEKAVASAQETLTKLQKRGALEKHSSLFGSVKALETPEHTFSTYGPVYAKQSSGRRLAFAHWVVDPDNPLTARVVVNHVWLRVFGKPLVAQAFDFGLQSPAPLHQDVLDYLAADLIDHQWSLRRLLRLMVTSQTYQRSSSNANASPDTLANDPNNRHYWRMNAKRMTSQQLRDSIRHAAGALDLSLGGPSLDAGKADTNPRRSLYLKHSRDDQQRFLNTFDDASILACYRREESVTPQQALAMANDKMIERAATQLVGGVSPSGSEDVFITNMFARLLGRDPSASEMTAMQTALAQFSAMASSPGTQRARRNVVMALLNHNDFLTIR